MDAKVNKLEDEIKEAFLIKTSRVVRKCVYNHIDKLENYRRELVILLPWLGLHITKRSNHDSVLQVVKCTRPTTTIEGGDFL